MALVDVDSWQTEFESCKRLSNTLLSQLNQRDGKQHLSAEYNRFTTAIQVGLRQHDRELQQLRFKLNEAEKNKTLSAEELVQRKRLLDTLQTQRQNLQRKYTNTANNDRAALLENPSSSAAAAASGEDSDAAPIIDAHDIQTLKQQQISMLEEQNRGLDTLSQTLSRQRQLATQLGQEVEDQNDILDNLANTIERVETGVSIETRNIGLVNRRDSSTWGYWVIIFTLMVIITVVAVL
ncbi:syntaxin-8 [Lucilia sericata]|uniref:syntaxin-8 n=1 Tax=Lucilia sericata TaxID=13632 RepID=UPI0018A831C1|nr:syntaxin-8 [Lucilia sericata]